MKLLIAIFLLAIGSFAQNTTYKNGTECKCDSINNSVADDGTFIERAYKNGEVTAHIFHNPDGSIYDQSQSNEKIGMHTLVDSNGNILRISKWGNGELIELWYDDNGVVERMAQCSYKLKINKHKNFEMEYSEGCPDKSFYKNGQIKSVRKSYGHLSDNTHKENTLYYFNDGRYAGERITIFKNGISLTEVNCADGRFGNEMLNCLK